MADAQVTATPIGPGVYSVLHEGRNETVYVAGPPGRRWAFWNGQVFREDRGPSPHPSAQGRRSGAIPPVTAPMPATVLKILVAPGARVSKGDVLLVVEAMKMELPLRAPEDAAVSAVRCREGELVQPDAVLVELS